MDWNFMSWIKWKLSTQMIWLSGCRNYGKSLFEMLKIKKHNSKLRKDLILLRHPDEHQNENYCHDKGLHAANKSYSRLSW